MRQNLHLTGHPLIVVSIHASVKDATQVPQCSSSLGKVSIHASVKDATVHFDSQLQITAVSIHASVKDATDCRPLHPSIQRFQSTHL